MNHIFMSYSRRDSDFVDNLIRELATRGLDTWRDSEDIHGGAEWRAAISQAIRGCFAFVVVLSPLCMDSKNVTKELSLAETHQKPIIPVLYKPCEISSLMEYQLAGIQWVDFAQNPFEQAVASLLQSLNYQSPKEAGPIPPPPPPTIVAAPQVTSVRPRLKFCIHCGSEIPPKKIFCTKCGRRLGT